MKAITRYRADDGTEHANEERCLAHEALCAEIGKIISKLQPRPEGSGFSNGEGYIQQDGNIVSSIDRALRGHGDIPEIGPLFRAWERMRSIDTLYREWGQPYYAAHPSQGEQIQLNKPKDNTL